MKKYLTSIAFVVMFLGAASFAPQAHASTSDLTGWAWSSNIGWISFNSANNGSGGGSYKVSVDTSTTPAKISGWAWSSNIGWIDFNAADAVVSACGTGPTVNITTGLVAGWAAVYSDGSCIELSSSPNHSSPNATGNGGVTFVPSTGIFTGYAFEPNYIGWLSFNASTSVSVNCPTCTTGGPDFTVTGSSITVSTTSPTQTATVTIAKAGSDSTTQTINLAKGTIPSGLSTGALSASTCILTTVNASCTITFSVTLTNLSNPSSSYTIPVIGTRQSDSAIRNDSVVVAVYTPVAPPSGSLSLYIGKVYIGKDGASAALATYKVKQGGTFGLSWTNGLSNDPNTGYSCTSELSNPLANWGTVWTSGSSVAVGSNHTITPMNTAGVTPGASTDL